MFIKPAVLHLNPFVKCSTSSFLPVIVRRKCYDETYKQYCVAHIGGGCPGADGHHLCSAIDVPLDSNAQQPARNAEERVGFAQGLHPCSLQRPASRVCVKPRLIELWLHELRPL